VIATTKTVNVVSVNDLGVKAVSMTPFDRSGIALTKFLSSGCRCVPVLVSSGAPP